MTVFNRTTIFVILVLVIDGCHSGRFHCRPRSPLTIFIGRSSQTRQPDYLVVEEDWMPPKPLNSQQRICKWVLELGAPTPRQVVFREIQRSSLSDYKEKRSLSNSTSTTFRLSDSANDQCTNQMKQSPTLSVETFILRSLRVQHHLTLSTNLPSEMPLVSIAVSSMDPGYCAQDMVLHNGKCHLVIKQQNSSLYEAMQIISKSSSAGLQLASFSSVEEIRTFVKSNYEPDDVLPPKQPLNLIMPVRIGLFYSRLSDSVFESVVTEKGCEMRLHPNSTDILSASKSLGGPCGALQANNSETPVILFVSCNQPIPPLISFPETPENATCTDCNRNIHEWVEVIKHHDLPIKVISIHKATQYKFSVAVVSVIVGCILLIGIIIAFVFCKKYHAGLYQLQDVNLNKPPFKYSNNNSSKNSASSSKPE